MNLNETEYIHFAHGSGFCMSRPMADLISKVVYKNLLTVYNHFRTGDDVMLGAIINFYGENVTQIKNVIPNVRG